MILLYIFGGVAFVNCLYYLLFSNFFFSRQPKQNVWANFPISLIVCAKNESENLHRHIPLWLSQKNTNFELILINDASTDNTLEVMEFFANQDGRIKIVNVLNNEAFWANKKYALTLGIKKARHEKLIFTDADCYPASEEWLSNMVSNFSNEKEIVLGYGAYEKFPGLLNKIIRFETLLTAVQYFSYSYYGIPYMGVGRNLAYTSELYYDRNGFMNHMKIASGDDDLFVNEAATEENTINCISPEAFTYSIPKKKWKQWRHQKSRHYSTAKFYKPIHKFLLGVNYIFNLLFWIFSIIILFTDQWKFGLAIILLRFIFQYFAVGKAAEKLRESDLIPYIPFFELFLILLQLSIFISNRDEKTSQWK